MDLLLKPVEMFQYPTELFLSRMWLVLTPVELLYFRLHREAVRE
jgi:hypothetical protein